MTEKYGYCGILCSYCPAYKATMDDDDEARAKVAEEWSKQFGHEFKIEDINCTGCNSEGTTFSYCSICDIRKCAMDKGVKLCAYCVDYPCEKLEPIHSNVPEAKEYLDKLNKGL